MFSTIKNASKLVCIKKLLPVSFRCSSFGNEKGVIKSTFPDVEIPNISITECIFKNFHKFPQKIAVECSSTGRKYTYEDVLIKSRNFNRVLRKIFKLVPRDVVAIVLPNIPEYSICVYGCLDANLVITTINPTYTADEISKQLLDTDAKLVITLTTLYSVVDESLKLTNRRIPILTVKTEESESLPREAINLHELLNTNVDIEDIPLPNSNDLAILPYSSGTTGLPKGVQLTHRNIVANFAQVEHPDIKIYTETSDTHQDVVPAMLPFFHIFGFSALVVAHMAALNKIVTVLKFAPDTFTNLLKTYKPHTLFAVPSMINFISNYVHIKSEDLKSLRTVVSGAAPLSGKDEEKLLKKAASDLVIKQGYGLTETSPVILLTTNRTLKLCTPGSVGEVLSNTKVKLVNKDNKLVLDANEPGELLVKGPQVMRSYFKRPEESRNAFADGYFKTGDLCYYDENKSFYIIERLKDLIKVKGFQVAPAELEDILRTHPDVVDAGVIGVSHSKYGEVPKAYIVPKPNCTVKTDEILGYVTKRVVNYKRLIGGLSVIDNIPKNAAGKILRKDLQQLHKEEMKL
ncbi:hypothetical protein FQA39_LY02035 [Lamprigera yunnana]|nr:hypothetical protein FQA39_LY02035 [Lamprigera yunnana]